MVRYEGPGSAVRGLAGCLRDEGLEVSYRPPPEFRSFPEPATLVLIYVGMKVAEVVAEVAQEELKAALRRAIAKYRERGGPGEITPEE